MFKLTTRRVATALATPVLAATAIVVAPQAAQAITGQPCYGSSCVGKLPTLSNANGNCAQGAYNPYTGTWADGAYNGPLAEARVWVDFSPAAGAGFRIALEHVPADAHACAVALLAVSGGRVVVRREVRYVPGFQQELDRAYGFGLRWAREDKPGLG